MKDREFIELLNLYVDREISAADALRLESEVVSNPKRREVYDQYCRMQKACTMLSQDQIEASAPATERAIVNFPSRSAWTFGPTALGLAAALACAAGIVTFKLREAHSDQAYAQVAANLSNAPRAPARASDSDAMKPVFVVSRIPVDTAFAGDSLARSDQLNWIGNVQMPPVFATPGQEFILAPKTEMKAAAIADAQAERDSQEPAEMTAFRFQR
jgi:hypothetical protein